jgi:hypothetical protein
MSCGGSLVRQYTPDSAGFRKSPPLFPYDFLSTCVERTRMLPHAMTWAAAQCGAGSGVDFGHRTSLAKVTRAGKASISAPV